MEINIRTLRDIVNSFRLTQEQREYLVKSIMAGNNVNTTWEEIQNKPTFADVATSGDYDDLTNTPDLTIYQPKTDDSLDTDAKTIPAAINEIKESVDSISDPYEINLTNLLSAEDSESISTAIGGIDKLNATVQDNRIIVGTISNGSVSVSIRIFGNVTTLYYLLDSVVGLTLNEIAITNTSGTLSKKITTHSVITENMVINSLDSDETTLPLSAAQGKALQKVINSKQNIITAGTGLEFEGTILNVTLDTTVFKVVSALSDSPAQGDENKIHLVPAESTGANNTYTEYIWVNSAWEILGEYTSEVDLTPYLKIKDAAATYLTKVDAADTYQPKGEYQPVGDYATNTALTEGLATKQPVGDYATNPALTQGLEGKQDKGDYALKSELPSYTTVPELTADYTVPANTTTMEFIYQIPVGETIYSILGAEGIKWVNDVAPVIHANKTYIVSVVNNLAVWGEF